MWLVRPRLLDRPLAAISVRRARRAAARSNGGSEGVATPVTGPPRREPDSPPKLAISSRETSLVSRALDPPLGTSRESFRDDAPRGHAARPGVTIHRSTVRIPMIHAWPANNADEIVAALDYAEDISWILRTKILSRQNVAFPVVFFFPFA